MRHSKNAPQTKQEEKNLGIEGRNVSIPKRARLAPIARVLISDTGSICAGVHSKHIQHIVTKTRQLDTKRSWARTRRDEMIMGNWLWHTNVPLGISRR